jgi:hypothetical protein
MFIVFVNNVIGFQLSIELKLEKFEKDIKQTIDEKSTNFGFNKSM